MADRHALDDLNRLLDRHERSPAASTLSLRIDVGSFSSQRRLDDYIEALKDAAASGGIVIKPRRGLRRNEPPVVSLGDPQALYGYLGRTPPAEASARTLARLEALATETWLRSGLSELALSWSLRRDWYGLKPDDDLGVARATSLARAIVEQRHLGQDYRTLSVSVAGDSKFLENHEAAVVRLVSFAQAVPSLPPRAALSALGLDRIAIPFHLSSAIAVDGERLPKALPYFAVPHDCVPLISFWRQPAYVLTIENLVSFHRYTTELNVDLEGLVVFTGGQPSLSWIRSMTTLRSQLPASVPFFHWSDIDGGGLEIFRTLENSFGTLIPHLMSEDLAERYGYAVPSPVVRPGQFAGSAVSTLADYLARPEGKCLEQESITPERPTLP